MFNKDSSPVEVDAVLFSTEIHVDKYINVDIEEAPMISSLILIKKSQVKTKLKNTPVTPIPSMCQELNTL